MGIEDVENFEFVDPPDKDQVQQAVQSLKTLGALDESGNITKTGELMADLGLEPKLGRMVIEASRHNCVDEICTTAAIPSLKRVLFRNEEVKYDADIAHARFKDPESDFITSLNIWKAYEEQGLQCNWNYREMRDWCKENFLNSKALDEARKVRQELFRVLRRNKIYADPRKNGQEIDKVAVGKAVASGLIENLLDYSSYHRFEKVDGSKDSIYVHPSSTTFGRADGELIITSQIFTITDRQGREKTYASNCMIVKPDWIPEIAPQLVNEEIYSRPVYNPESDKVEKRMRQKLKRTGRELGYREEAVQGEEAILAFATALVEGKVKTIPASITETMAVNEVKRQKLNRYWQKAAKQLKS